MATLRHYRERLLEWAIEAKMDGFEIDLTKLTAAAWATVACFMTKTLRMYYAESAELQWKGKGVDRQASDMADINMYKDRKRRPLYIQTCRNCGARPCMHYYCKHMLGKETVVKTKYVCLLCWAKEGTVTMNARKVMEEVIESELPNAKEKDKTKAKKRKQMLKYFNICKSCGERKKWLVYKAAMKIETKNKEEDIIFALIRQAYLEVINSGTGKIVTVTTYRYLIKKIVAHAIKEECENKVNNRMRKDLFEREVKEKITKWLQKSYAGLTQTTRDIFKEKEEEKEGKETREKNCKCEEYLETIKDMIVYL